jgi:hypothetical protein
LQEAFKFHFRNYGQYLCNHNIESSPPPHYLGVERDVEASGENFSDSISDDSDHDELPGYDSDDSDIQVHQQDVSTLNDIPLTMSDLSLNESKVIIIIISYGFSFNLNTQALIMIDVYILQRDYGTEAVAT